MIRKFIDLLFPALAIKAMEHQGICQNAGNCRVDVADKVLTKTSVLFFVIGRSFAKLE
jgi:hypothetical protein